MKDEELTAIADAIEALSKRLDRMENTSVDAMAKERRASERERRLLAQEREASESASASYANKMSELQAQVDDGLSEMRQMVANRGKADASRSILMNEAVEEAKQELRQAMQEFGDLQSQFRTLRSDADLARQQIDTANIEFAQAKQPLQAMAEDFLVQAKQKDDQRRLNEAVQNQLRMMLETGQIQVVNPNAPIPPNPPESAA